MHATMVKENRIGVFMTKSKSVLNTVLFVIAFIVSISNAAAQSDSAAPVYTGGQDPTMDDMILDKIKNKPLDVQVGASFMVCNPQDSLRTAIQKLTYPPVGYGFGLHAAYMYDPVPVVIGGDFGMNFFGGDSRKIFTAGQGGTTDTTTYSVTNFQMPVTVFARLQANIASWVFPYVEIDGGFTWFHSMLSIEKVNGDNSDSDGEGAGSVSWTYGVGAGMMVKFADIITLPNSLQRYLVDVRFRYLRGTPADVPSIALSDPGPTYKIERATVDVPSMILFNIGITAQF